MVIYENYIVEARIGRSDRRQSTPSTGSSRILETRHPEIRRCDATRAHGAHTHTLAHTVVTH